MPCKVSQTSRESRATFRVDLRNSTRLRIEKIFFAPSTGLIFFRSGLTLSRLSRKPYWPTWLSTTTSAATSRTGASR